MSKPKRIQRSRVKGWKMPANAIYVGRSTVWGNPYVVGSQLMNGETLNAEKAVALYEQHLADNFNERDIRHCLRGKDLAAEVARVAGKLRADFRKRTECALRNQADGCLTEVVAEGSLHSVHVAGCAADAIVTLGSGSSGPSLSDSAESLPALQTALSLGRAR